MTNLLTFLLVFGILLTLCILIDKLKKTPIASSTPRAGLSLPPSQTVSLDNGEMSVVSPRSEKIGRPPPFGIIRRKRIQANNSIALDYKYIPEILNLLDHFLAFSYQGIPPRILQNFAKLIFRYLLEWLCRRNNHLPKGLSDQLFDYDFPRLLAVLHPYEPELMRTSFKPLDCWATKFSSKARQSNDQLQKEMIEFRGFILLFLHAIKDKSAELKESLDEKYPLQVNSPQDLLIQVNKDSKETTIPNVSQGPPESGLKNVKITNSPREEKPAEPKPICPICQKPFQKNREGLWVCSPCNFYLEYIELGEIKDRYRQGPSSYEPFLLKIADFNTHSLILGSPGGGKTYTGLWIAYQLREAGVPVWVFECEGTQWRSLIRMDCRNPNAVEKILIFTIQDILHNTFVMNPLEPPPGVPIEKHTANFVDNFAYTYSLEDWAAEKIKAAVTLNLEKKGWDIAKNKRTGKEDEYHYPLPVELMEDIEEVLREYVTYRGDLKAHLDTRLRAFNMWSLAYTWNTRKSVPWDELLSSNVVFELHNMNNSSKQFFVLTMLTMALECVTALGEIPSGKPPRLVIIIEEAGDILTQEAHEESRTSVSTQLQKMIDKIISETRKFGLGLVVMDQTPERLPPRVRTNSQTGIIHNLTSKDSLDQVMNIFRNIDYIPQLKPGEVLCRTPQKVRQVKVHRFPYKTMTEAEIQTHMTPFYAAHPWLKQTEPDIEAKIHAAMIYSKSKTERDQTEVARYEPFLMGLTSEDIDPSTEVPPSEIDLFCAEIEFDTFSSVPTLKTRLAQFKNIYSVTEDLKTILRAKYEQPAAHCTILDLQTQLNQTDPSGIRLRQVLRSCFSSLFELATINESYSVDLSTIIYSFRLLVFKYLKFTSQQRIPIYNTLLELVVELLNQNANIEVR